jgi:chromosomal replication initiator protein
MTVVGPLEPARLDPRLTFDTYVVGEGNRLAVAASRRAAEAPGAHYNPLFLYSASGLGKSHLLHAMAHHAVSVDSERRVFYQSPEVYVEGLAQALARGVGDAVLETFRRTDLLLLDDVQFLAGNGAAQEALLRTLDALTASGAQVVLASDRPPSEIDGLDARLLSRFSGGLLVDIGDPEYTTRVQILRRKAEDRGAVLAPGVAEALARPSYRSVRELQGTLNRVIAIQELQERILRVEDLAQAVGPQFEGMMSNAAVAEDSDAASTVPSGSGPGVERGREPGAGSDATGAPLDPRETQLRRILTCLEDAGYATARLDSLVAPTAPRTEGWTAPLVAYRADVDRLREIEAEVNALGNPWAEGTRALFRDPDLRNEAEALLERVRAWANPFVSPDAGPRLEEAAAGVSTLAREMVRRGVEGSGERVNPVMVHSEASGRARDVLDAAIRTYLDLHPDGRVIRVTADAFADGFVDAVAEGILPHWRERWGRADLVVVHLQDTIPFTARVQEEFFHLYEALERGGQRLVLSAGCHPRALTGIDERLLSRFEGGLVVALDTEPSNP